MMLSEQVSGKLSVWGILLAGCIAAAALPTLTLAKPPTSNLESAGAVSEAPLTERPLDVEIACEGPYRKAEELKPPIEELKMFELLAQFKGDIQFKGAVQYKFHDGLTTVRGRGLSVNADNGLTFECDEGVLRRKSEKEGFSAELRGNAGFAFLDLATYSADEITFDTGSGMLTLQGNVDAKVYETRFRCDRLIHNANSNTIEITGNATMTRPSKEEECEGNANAKTLGQEMISGPEIIFDYGSEMLKRRGNVDATANEARVHFGRLIHNANSNTLVITGGATVTKP